MPFCDDRTLDLALTSHVVRTSHFALRTSHVARRTSHVDFARRTSHFDMNILVVGAGVFGAWAALELARAGHRVRLIDAYGPGNGRASSTDFSRICEPDTAADAIYSEWAVRSRERWLWLSAEAGTALFEETGALFMGEPGHAYILETHDTLSALGFRWNGSIRWTSVAAGRSSPPQGIGPAVYEPHAGVLRARAAVRAAVQLGVEAISRGLFDEVPRAAR